MAAPAPAHSMKYRFLGDSGLLVSTLSFGSWVTFDGEPDVEKIYDILVHAYKNGVNFFDNAEIYAEGQAEVIMGKAIQLGIERGVWTREDLVISTKIFWGTKGLGRGTYGPNDIGLSRKHIIEGTKASLKRFGQDYVDLIFCHRPDPRTPIEETVRAMNYVIDQGWAFYWGTSEWNAHDIMKACEIADRLGLARPVMDQPQYHIFERSRVDYDYVNLYKKYKYGLTTWSPLASGVLTGKYSKGIPEGSRLSIPMIKAFVSNGLEDRITKSDKLAEVAKEVGATLAQFSIAWVAANENVSTVILGATSIAQLDENLKALEFVDKITPEIRAKVDAIVQFTPEVVPTTEGVSPDLMRAEHVYEQQSISKREPTPRPDPMELKQTRHRFQSDPDIEEDVPHPQTHVPVRQRRAGSAGSNASRKGSSKGGSWCGAPAMLAVLALLALVTLVRMWQFASTGGLYHPPLTEPFFNKTMVELSTKFGKFTLELYPEHAPKSVETFLKLVDQGFYGSDAGFYRNEPNFVLQGGGFLAGKKSPFANVPVEYSLPSEERMVVIARGRKATSGSSEFAIMLHDNTESNKPTEDGPGYTVFGRVIAGWHSIEQTSKTMRVGYLGKEDLDRQTDFESVEYVSRISHESLEVRKRLEELTYALETPYTVVVFAEDECPEAKEITAIFVKLKAAVRVIPIGSSAAHPYEREALQALTGQETLPLVYINTKLVGGLEEVKALNKDGRLQALLERSGALAEPTVWNAIKQYPLVVFSKSYCPYCKKAKETLKALGAKPYVFELDLRQDGPAIQSFLFQFTHQSTVPNVFIKGRSIGGADDTVKLYKSGELEEKLKKAGAI